MTIVKRYRTKAKAASAAKTLRRLGFRAFLTFNDHKGVFVTGRKK